MTIQEGHLELVKLLVTFSAQLTEGNRLGRRVSLIAGQIVSVSGNPPETSYFRSVQKYDSI